MFDTIRRRLTADDHVTFTLLRYEVDGTVRFAGSHEELIVWRAGTGVCEQIPTPGTWLGAVPDVDAATTEQRLQLASGDLLVLYTDGVIEARNVQRRQFGIDQLCQLVNRLGRNCSSDEIYQAIVSAVLAWGPQDDDITVVVLRKQ